MGEYSAPAILVAAIVLMIKTALELIMRRRNGRNGDQRIAKMAEQISELYRMHDKTDDDGVPVWYVRKSLEEAVRSLIESVKQQSKGLEKVKEEVTHLHRKLTEHQR